MKYVALLSGGKDSCFNLVHCSQNSHELVAAASLGPGGGKEEIDSYLYQTVGQDAIEFVAQALDVPLYRRVISGLPIQQGAEYGSREARTRSAIDGDETEDLFELLSDVKREHPDVTGVSAGAILSNYQRVRVEHVWASSFSFKRDQDELLNEIIESRVKAVIIKVAGIGLKSKHLGKTLAEMQSTLRDLNRLYGAHICGEGGEYETLSLDCPLFKRSLHLDETETVIHADNDFATVAYLRIKTVSLREKPVHEETHFARPSLLDHPHETLCRSLTEREHHIRGPSTTRQLEALDGCAISRNCKEHGPWISISNVQVDTPNSGASVRVEVEHCFNAVKGALSQYSLTLSDLTFVNVIVSDMALFTEVNDTYKEFFGTSPPARACVAARLPGGIRLRLDCLAYITQSASERQALHVQSLSYWAPANIGPYSQAILVGDRVFISGQIGMRPSDLSMPAPTSFPLEAALSLQHAHRILQAMRDTHGSAWNPVTQSLICWIIDTQYISLMQVLGQLLDSYASTTMLFVGPTMLPKGALIENQVVIHTGQYTEMDEGEAEIRTSQPAFLDSGHVEVDQSTAYWEMSSFRDISAFCAVVAVRGNPAGIQEALNRQLWERYSSRKAFSARLFHHISLQESMLSFAQRLLLIGDGATISSVPVEFIATRNAVAWDFALSIIG